MPTYGCIIEDCGKKARNRKMCWRHYQRERRHGSPTAGGNTRIHILEPIPKIAEVSNLQLAYIAGFFDGEGSVGIYKGKHGNIFKVAVGQMDTRPIRDLVNIFGGSVTLKKDNNISVWQASTLYAYAFLKAVRPYLVVKASQADVFIQMIEDLRAGKVIDIDAVALKVKELKHSYL